MSIRDHFDIDSPALAPALDGGLLAMLGERAGAVRSIIPAGEGGSTPAPAPAPKPKPKPKPKPAPVPAAAPTPVKSTPTRSIDQASQGAANTQSTPTKPKPAPKPKPKAEPKDTAKPTKNAPSANDTPVRGANRVAKSEKADKPATTDKVNAPGTPAADETSTPAIDIESRDYIQQMKLDAGQTRLKLMAREQRRTERQGDDTTTDAGSSTPAVDIESRDYITQLKIEAGQDRLKLAAREARREERIAARDESTPVVDIDSAEGITKLKIQAAQDRLKAEARAERRDNAENLDKRYTDEEIAEIQAAQQRLRKQERRLREQNTPDQTEQVEDVAPRNRYFREEAAEMDANTTQTRKEKITELREEYFANNEVWVDADGTVYQASVNENGRIVGVRENTNPAGEGSRETVETRTVSIGVMNHRFDTNRLETVPTGTPGEVNEVRIERLHTGPRGRTLGSSLESRQERENRDGTIERSRTREEYDERGLATKLEERQAVIGADGKLVTRNGRDTYFREDGQTPEHTVETALSFTGGDTGTRREETAVTTYFRRDGVTPRHEMVVNDTWDANGNEPMSVYASTDFTKAGDPISTFTRRELPVDSDRGQGDGGELPEGVSARDYVKWNADGTIAGKAEGGAGLTETDFQGFLKDGTKPETVAVDQADIDDLAERIDDDRELIENGTSYSGSNGSVYRTPEAQEAYDRMAAQVAELEQLEQDKAFYDDHQVSEVDTSLPTGHEDAVRYERTTQNGDDGRWDGEGLGAPLAPPLQASTSTASVFEVPAMLESRANAKALDSSKYATSPAALEQLVREQGEYERAVGGAKTDAQRERIMREYFSDHDYWVDGAGSDAPVLMASGWSDGAPQSSAVFGATRQADPHASLARTGIQGQDTEGNPATVDVLKHLYTDGTRDEVVRTSYDGPAGASRVSVTGEHITAGGVITERDTNVESQVPRTREGKEPLAITEVARERFDEKSGLPVGEQYAAVATSDDSMTTLEEQRDTYTQDGVIADTKIDSTHMTRTFDEETTNDFLDANRAALEAASGGKDSFHPDDKQFQDIEVPAVGSSWSHSETDIDYDTKGVAIYSRTDEESLRVVDSDDETGNGVQVIETDGTSSYGERGGYEPIFNKRGEPIVDNVSKTTITTSEFDPDAGRAGGDGNENNQFRMITSVTAGQTTKPDGSVTSKWATPLQTDTLNEGSDDDWIFERKYLKTTTDTKDGAPFDVVLDDDEMPVELGAGDEVYSENGNLVIKQHDGRKEGDLDAADKFEEFMGGWGGKIVGGIAVVAGVAAAFFTAGSSLAITALGVSLLAGSASLAATATNYSQGEASGWDVALSAAGVIIPGAGAVLAKGARAATLANAARTGGAGSSAASTVADDVVRAGAHRAGLTRTVTVSEVGLDGYDVVEAGRAALRGDFYGAGLVLLAGLGGVAAPKLRGRLGGGSGGANGAPDVQHGQGTTDLGTPSSTQVVLPDNGSTTGALLDDPIVVPRNRNDRDGDSTDDSTPDTQDGADTEVDGARGGPDVPSVPTAPTDAPVPGTPTGNGPRRPIPAQAGRNAPIGEQTVIVPGSAQRPLLQRLQDRIAGRDPQLPARASTYSRIQPDAVVNIDPSATGLQVPGAGLESLVGTTARFGQDGNQQAHVIGVTTLFDGRPASVVETGYAPVPFDLAAIRAENPGIPADATPASIAGRIVMSSFHGRPHSYRVSPDGTLVDTETSRQVLSQQQLSFLRLPSGNPANDIAYSQMRDPQFDGTSAMVDLVRNNPDSVLGQTVRIRHSQDAVEANGSLTRLSDGFEVTGFQRDVRTGEMHFTVEGANPQLPGQRVHRTVTPEELVSLNRARLEGDVGQLNDISVNVDGVRYDSPEAAATAIGSDIPIRAHQNMLAFQDWYYAAHGRAPFGGREQTITFTSDPQARNNAMRTPGDEMLIGMSTSGRGAAFSPGTIAHESGHGIMFDLSGANLRLSNTEAGAVQEAVGDFYGGVYTGDWNFARGFDLHRQNGLGRDVISGDGLVTHYREYQELGARDPRAGVEEHAGSGVVSIALRDIHGSLGDADSLHLMDMTLRQPAMRHAYDFRTFSDSMRQTAIAEFGIDDPRTRTVIRSLANRGLVPDATPGEYVTVITSRGDVERPNGYLEREYSVAGFRDNGDVTLRTIDEFGMVQEFDVRPGQVRWGHSRNPNDLEAATNPYPSTGHSHSHAAAGATAQPTAGTGLDPAILRMSESIQARVPQGRLWGPDSVEARAHIERRHTVEARRNARQATLDGTGTPHMVTTPFTIDGVDLTNDATVAELAERTMTDFDARGSISVFHPELDARGIDSLIDQAYADGTWVPNRIGVAESNRSAVFYEFPEPIGYDGYSFREDGDGQITDVAKDKNLTRWMRVLIDEDGQLLSAQPINEKAVRRALDPTSYPTAAATPVTPWPTGAAAAPAMPAASATANATSRGGVHRADAGRIAPWTGGLRDRIANVSPRDAAMAALRAPLLTPAAMNAAIQAQAQIERERVALASQLAALQQQLEAIAASGGRVTRQ